MNREKIYASRQMAGRVRRFHTWPVIHQQTVAEHSARVASLVVEIFGMPRAEVLYYALHHDSGELWGGDVPYGAKRNGDGKLKEACNDAEKIGLKLLGVQLPEITALEWAQVKIADILEMWEYGRAEVAMGNQFCECVVRDVLVAAQRMASEICHSAEVNKWLAAQEW